MGIVWAPSFQNDGLQSDAMVLGAPLRNGNVPVETPRNIPLMGNTN